MKKLFVELSLVCIVSVNCSVSLTAYETKLDEILSNLEKNDEAVENIKFNYTQDITYTLTNEIQHTYGQMIFSKPNNFYFKQDKPLDQEIVSNGKKVWIYTPSYKQVIVDDVQRWLKSGILPNSTISLNLNWKELKSKYSFEYLGEENGAYLLLFTPLAVQAEAKDGSLNSWKMKLWFDTKEYSPLRVDLLGENISVITKISGYARDQKIDKKIFVFKAPKGVDIMRMSK
ncbi:MAG: outer membrane lipoprotein carrier protein LolA [Elusimicrobia bacterium]|nr:outer membrane lipoprotein carrier protein LolA [Candidatus Liberimonas magnetica]